MNTSYITRENMRDFNSTVQNIFRWSKNPSDLTQLSFSKWIERAQSCRAALLKNKQLRDEELKNMENTWATHVIDEKRKAFDEEKVGLAKIAKDMILKDLDAVISAKEAKYHEAMKGPSEEQIRLLSILQMRMDSGETLSSSDFANVTRFCADNYHVLRQLGNMAKNANIPFPRFEDTFQADVNTAREGAIDFLRSIDVPKENLEYYELLFWTTGNAGLYQDAFNKLDKPHYLSITPEDVKQAAIDESVKEEARKSSEARNATPAASKFCSKVKLNGLEDIYVVAEQFHTSRAAIAELNPGMDLDHLYKGGELFVPSVRFTYSPGSTAAVQENQITLAEKPVITPPVGPHGEQPGDDINVIVSEAFD